MSSPSPTPKLSDYLARYRAALVILSGEARGMEHGIDQAQVAVGRGPGVDLALDDASLRRSHALLEFQGRGFVLRDVGEDGRAGVALELKDGDRFRLGVHEFAFVLEPRVRDAASF